jgi:methionyl-tRNA formyltransferase
MDGGDIVGQKEVKIGPDSTAPEIYDAICESTAELIIEFLSALAKGSVIRMPQNYFSGSLCCSRTPSDGLIDWFDTSHNIYNLIRALTFPYPGAYTYYEGEKLIILKADIIENPPNYIGRIPGRVIGFSTEDGWVDVLTGDGILRIKEVQRINQEKTQAATVIRSIKKSLGLSMQFLMDKISELEKRIVELITNQKNPY